MTHLPTTPIGVPYAGAPLTAADIIQERVNFEDRKMRREESHATVVPPSKRVDYTKLKFTKTVKVAFGAQVRRFAMSVINV